MTAREVVLLVLDAYGGSIAGRTLLQKICYFVGVTHRLDLNYRAHYYGPYSASVEEAVGQLKSLGYVTENSIGFGLFSQFGEMRRFDYRLTEDGIDLAEALKRRHPDMYAEIVDAVRRIRKNGQPGYEELSIAAKT